MCLQCSLKPQGKNAAAASWPQPPEGACDAAFSAFFPCGCGAGAVRLLGITTY